MLHCDRFRWMLPLLTGAMLVTGNSAQADVVIDNGSLSIGVGSIERDRFYSPRYDNRRPTQIFTNRIENLTLINPVVIEVPIENSTLINPVVVSPSRRTVIVTPSSRRTTLSDRAPARSANMSCNYFASQRPACW